MYAHANTYAVYQAPTKHSQVETGGCGGRQHGHVQRKAVVMCRRVTGQYQSAPTKPWMTWV